MYFIEVYTEVYKMFHLTMKQKLIWEDYTVLEYNLHMNRRLLQRSISVPSKALTHKPSCSEACPYGRQVWSSDLDQGKPWSRSSCGVLPALGCLELGEEPPNHSTLENHDYYPSIWSQFIKNSTPKMKILSLFTYPNVFPNPYDLLSWWNDRTFIFGWTIPLTGNPIASVCPRNAKTFSHMKDSVNG